MRTRDPRANESLGTRPRNASNKTKKQSLLVFRSDAEKIVLGLFIIESNRTFYKARFIRMDFFRRNVLE